MLDLIYLLVILAFFGVAVLLVRGCDRLIGPDPELPDVTSDDESAVDDLEVATR